MNESRAALRYAKATLNLAVEKKATDTVEKDMQGIIDTIGESKELHDLLNSPVVKGADKKQVLKTLFKGGNAITEGLITALVDNKRIALLQEVALKYIILNEQLKGQDIGYVTTAVPMTSDLEGKILEKVVAITGKKVTLENKVDASIVGGFILRVGDLQYDASIASKLNGLKREFTNSL
ncbi:ATP synthase F1 subunit delta [Spongiimicrobium salis]|uniref:ATP synthase F1 subunit delta n=1 Tax=Spongiimicrobium salis TaxID=1667022 RepID=UPI00374DB8C9